jgi:hypothetical protein
VNDLDQIIALILGILLAISGLLVLLTRLESTLKSELSPGGTTSRRRRSRKPAVLAKDAAEAE